MSKKIKFHTVSHGDTEAKIQQTLNAEFALPKAVLEAKEQAFQQIRQGKVLEESGGISHTKAKKRKTISKVYKIAGCTAAAAAVFSAVCITNPAWASNIPLIGNIFEELGNSLGFSGDYSEYAKPLQDAPKEESKEAGSAQDNASTADGEQDPKGTDTAFRKTVDGVTVTLSEVYCNDAALYLSLLVESEEPIPDTMMFQDKVPEIKLENSDMILSYNPDYTLLNAYLDGKMIDENTYAGVLRVDMKDTSINEAGQSAYYEARDAFLSEMGIDMEKVESGEISVDDIAQQLGLEEFSDEAIKEMGGPDMAEYEQPLEIPEKFTVDLSIGAIVGTLPQEMDTTPEMPRSLWMNITRPWQRAGWTRTIMRISQKKKWRSSISFIQKCGTNMWKCIRRWPTRRILIIPGSIPGTGIFPSRWKKITRRRLQKKWIYWMKKEMESCLLPAHLLRSL